MFDLDRGWPTERLDLEPLAVAHAAELAPLLDDAALHEFHPGHLASQRVARAAGLSPTTDIRDGETRWVSPALAAR